RCSEETIPGQRFCRRCGLALPTGPGQPEGQVVAQFVGARVSEAAGANDASNLRTLPGTTGSWWETPTQPVITTNAEGAAAPNGRGRWAWLTVLLLVAVTVSSLGTYLVIHAQTQEAARS